MSNLTSLFTDIANTIRTKKGTTAEIVAENFPQEIASITTVNNQDKTITESGIFTADTGYTGLGTVTVDVVSGTRTYNSLNEVNPDELKLGENILIYDETTGQVQGLYIYNNPDWKDLIYLPLIANDSRTGELKFFGTPISKRALYEVMTSVLEDFSLNGDPFNNYILWAIDAQGDLCCYKTTDTVATRLGVIYTDPTKTGVIGVGDCGGQVLSALSITLEGVKISVETGEHDPAANKHTINFSETISVGNSFAGRKYTYSSSFIPTTIIMKTALVDGRIDENSWDDIVEAGVYDGSSFSRIDETIDVFQGKSEAFTKVPSIPEDNTVKIYSSLDEIDTDTVTNNTKVIIYDETTNTNKGFYNCVVEPDTDTIYLPLASDISTTYNTTISKAKLIRTINNTLTAYGASWLYSNFLVFFINQDGRLCVFNHAQAEMGGVVYEGSNPRIGVTTLQSTSSTTEHYVTVLDYENETFSGALSYGLAGVVTRYNNDGTVAGYNQICNNNSVVPLTLGLRIQIINNAVWEEGFANELVYTESADLSGIYFDVFQGKIVSFEEIPKAE
jgi:hypothetical protein